MDDALAAGEPPDEAWFDDDGGQPAEPPAEPDHGGGKLAGLVMAGMLVAAYVATGPRVEARPAFRAGAADAARILDGEVWRTATALMLHADLSHLVANATAAAFLATAVCRTVGAGLGAALIVASGVLGNLANTLLRGAPHVSVGASTAVLGAVGVLSGIAFVRQRRLPRGRAWVPLAAGLALLGMLGADPQSDLGAHFCGFLAGLALGAAASALAPAVPGPGVQRGLAVATAAGMLGAWWLALHP